MRHNTFCDHVFIALDQAMACLFSEPRTSTPHPGEGYGEAALNSREKRRVRALMRVNHAGEMAAQGLYLGQAQMARDEALRAHMYQAAGEESRHLYWCRQRLRELDGQPSMLDSAWFAGAWLMGLGAGWAGAAWSLGFLEETERQVVRHLDRHLQRLPEADQRSRAILERMKEEETGHALGAAQAGARPLPWWLRGSMALSARVMTGVSRYL